MSDKLGEVMARGKLTRAPKRKPVASHAIMGSVSQKTRVGTRYLYEVEDAWNARDKPYFRWTATGRAMLSTLSVGEGK